MRACSRAFHALHALHNHGMGADPTSLDHPCCPHVKMSSVVLLQLCKLLALQCSLEPDGGSGTGGGGFRVVVGVGNSTSGHVLSTVQGALSSLPALSCPPHRYTAEQSLPPLTDGTVDSVHSLSSALPFTAWGEVAGEGEGVEDQPQEEGEGTAEQVRTFYPLPFPAFDEGKADVATGTVSIWSFRNGACSPQAEPYPGPQTLALGWWSGNPRHPERGTVIAMCDGDRGESLIGDGLPASGGGVIIHCPDRSIRGRTYDSTCELIRFRNNACIAAVSSRSGNVFSYQFRCGN